MCDYADNRSVCGISVINGSMVHNPLKPLYMLYDVVRLELNNWMTFIF